MSNHRSKTDGKVSEAEKYTHQIILTLGLALKFNDALIVDFLFLFLRLDLTVSEDLVSAKLVFVPCHEMTGASKVKH